MGLVGVYCCCYELSFYDDWVYCVVLCEVIYGKTNVQLLVLALYILGLRGGGFRRFGAYISMEVLVVVVGVLWLRCVCCCLVDRGHRLIL